MSDYGSFAELQAGETHGVDFQIRFRHGTSGIAVMAIHGGEIEAGTTEIAEAVAGSRHTFYTFSGLKTVGNGRLHLPSQKFDEPLGLEIARRSGTVITIHGCREAEEIIYIGGRDRALIERITAALTSAGFAVGLSQRLKGIHPKNICNRTISGMGVQLEISQGLRERFFIDIARRYRKTATAAFHRFVEVLQGCLTAASGVEQGN